MWRDDGKHWDKDKDKDKERNCGTVGGWGRPPYPSRLKKSFENPRVPSKLRLGGFGSAYNPLVSMTDLKVPSLTSRVPVRVPACTISKGLKVPSFTSELSRPATEDALHERPTHLLTTTNARVLRADCPHAAAFSSPHNRKKYPTLFIFILP